MRRSEAELQQLRVEVDRARRTHRDALRGRRDPSLEMATRDDVLVALEDFVRALQVRHLPIPPAVQRDVKLLRSLCRRTRASARPTI